ncbi:MAG: DUF4405 domain-containing protein [Bacteroidales bacterium]
MKLFSYNKSKLNLSIDIVMFILLLAMAGIGFLMKYVVVSGEVRNVIYGNQVDLEFFGLTRHQWGSIHLTLSIIFLSLLVLHIILHWDIIVSVFKRMFPAGYIRYGIVGLICIFGAIALISPFILEPEKVPFEPKHRNRINNFPSSINLPIEAGNNEILKIQPSAESEKMNNKEEVQANNNSIIVSGPHDSEYKEFEVYGYQTLQAVSEKYNVPVGYLARNLNIPENLTKQKLGLIKRQYPFSMSDVRKIIFDFKKQNQK